MNPDHHHRHIHPGRPSSIFFTPDQVLGKLGIKEGDIILDAGCGDGFISLAASELVGESGLVFAVDLDPHSIDKVIQMARKKRIENIDVINADISRTLSIENRIIDLCLMVNVFHGIEENGETRAVMREMKRILKYDGKIVIVDFKKIESFPGPPVSTRLEPKRMESVLREHGFEKKDYFEIGKYHYAMVFRNL
jgi:ubiquinone/menaquinone biosynthesis C-methylase UbiE